MGNKARQTWFKTDMRLRRMLFAALIASSIVHASALPVGAEHAQPLGVGEAVPSASLTAPDGAELDLRELVLAQPSVIIVYRGGWCPYCNTHLGELATIEAELAAVGFRIIAFSPEQASTLAAAAQENPPQPGRLILSDRAMQASSALGLAYELPPALHERYLGYGLDLAPVPDSPEKHWLPVPAAYVVDQKGNISFAFTHTDIKQRVDLQELLAAARKLSE